MQAIGRLQQPDQMSRLLADKSPSVRTAVLRQVAENPSSKSLEILVEYLDTETDEDLLVFATSSLGEMPASDTVDTALVNLFESELWRVRAAVVDAIDEPQTLYRDNSFIQSSMDINERHADIILAACADSDRFVRGQAIKKLPQFIDDSTARKIADLLLNDPNLIVELAENDQLNFSPLVDALLVWIDSGDANERKTAILAIATLEPSRLNTVLSELIQSDDSEIRLISLKAGVKTLSEYRDQQLSKQLERFQSRIPTLRSSREPWHPVPDRFLQIGPSDAAVELQSDLMADDPTSETADSEKSSDQSSNELTSESTGEFDSLLSNMFGGSAAATTDGESDLDIRSGESEPSTESESTTDRAIDLSSVQGLFGEPISKPEPVEQAESNRGQRDSRTQTRMNDAPATWLANWQSGASDRVAWVRALTTQIESQMADPPSDSSDVEDAWRNLLLVACGQTTAVSRLDYETAIDNFGESTRPTLVEVLPWLPPAERLAAFQAIDITVANWDREENREVLEALTRFDDVEIANHLYDWISGTDIEDSQEATTAVKLVLAALTGSQVGPQQSSRSSDDLQKSKRAFVDFSSRLRYPTTLSASDWLSDKYAGETDVQMRAVLLSALSFIEHRLATQSAVGLIAMHSEKALENPAVEFNPELAVAVGIALSDQSEASADRACQWVAHPMLPVRQSAILALANPGFDNQSLSQLGTFSLFPFWQSFASYSNEELPAFTGNYLPARKDLIDIKVRSMKIESPKLTTAINILLLANGDPMIDPMELVGKVDWWGAYRKLTPAVVRSGRTDESTLAFLEAAFDDATYSDDRREIYKLLRLSEQPEIKELRKKLLPRINEEDDVFTF